MPVINRIAEFHDEIAAWRQDFHAHPEILYEVVRTAGVVEQKLREFGVDEVVTGIGRTGVVGIINGRTNTSGRTIALRADMDALPVTEKTGKDYASTVTGKMHACGHDGHTAMLLGAAKYLAETRNFDGRIALIFQPAEEGGAGGIMAATDRFYIDIIGQGGHAARPQTTVDPIIVAANMIVGLQSIVSRNVDPLASAVLSVTMVEAGEADNVISRTAKITGTVRTLALEVQDLIEQRLVDFVPQFAKSFGAEATVRYARGYPVTVNSPEQTDFAAEVARDVVGSDRVDADTPPSMGGEDFSFMLEERPGAYIFLGNGDSSELHTDTYDFNDEVIPVGVTYWVRLAERALPVDGR